MASTDPAYDMMLLERLLSIRYIRKFFPQGRFPSTHSSVPRLLKAASANRMLAGSPPQELATNQHLSASTTQRFTMNVKDYLLDRVLSRFHPLPNLTTHFPKIHLNVVPLYQFVHSCEHFPRTSQSKFSMHGFVSHLSVLSSPSQRSFFQRSKIN